MRLLVVVALALGACAPVASFAREPAHTEVTSDHYGDPIPEPPLESVPPTVVSAPRPRG